MSPGRAQTRTMLSTALPIPSRHRLGGALAALVLSGLALVATAAPASATNEFPVVAGTAMPERVAKYAAMPADPLPVETYGRYQAQAQRLFEEAGWR